ncbi:MAG TPA: hypothetical protein PKZ76_03725 [Xanthomonadaceae bacterium]|nr:hypothetical protein [Xanthomonadaceae bacterium]
MQFAFNQKMRAERYQSVAKTEEDATNLAVASGRAIRNETERVGTSQGPARMDYRPTLRGQPIGAPIYIEEGSWLGSLLGGGETYYTYPSAVSMEGGSGWGLAIGSGLVPQYSGTNPAINVDKLYAIVVNLPSGHEFNAELWANRSRANFQSRPVYVDHTSSGTVYKVQVYSGSFTCTVYSGSGQC